MRIDAETKLFVDLTYDEAIELRTFAETMILRGHIPQPLPNWCSTWMQLFDSSATNKLLMLSTAFVQHVLLSVVRYQADELAKCSCYS